MIRKIKYRVNRNSPEEKTQDFLKWMEAAKNEITHLVNIMLTNSTVYYVLNLLLLYIIQVEQKILNLKTGVGFDLCNKK